MHRCVTPALFWIICRLEMTQNSNVLVEYVCTAKTESDQEYLSHFQSKC